jgi:hypothetical protein
MSNKWPPSLEAPLNRCPRPSAAPSGDGPSRGLGRPEGNPNAPFLLELCSSPLDPLMPPMPGFRCQRDEMQETAFRQGIQRNHALLFQGDEMSCERRPSDACGNCIDPTWPVVAFPCPVKSQGKQPKFVIRSFGHTGKCYRKPGRREPAGGLARTWARAVILRGIRFNSTLG